MLMFIINTFILCNLLYKATVIIPNQHCKSQFSQGQQTDLSLDLLIFVYKML